MKIKAKPPEPYSILNPDTSSDSPSAKSNGVRFVSATQEINQITAMGGKTTHLLKYSIDILESANLNLFTVKMKNRITSANLIS